MNAPAALVDRKLLSDAVADASRRIAHATPMMRQYLETKMHYADCLLFYRMGDFYELFFEDAKSAAQALGIALTKRGTVGGEDIAMCGVPHHSYAPYLNKLIRAGYKVAVCEQMETPEEAKKRGYKAVVKREVIRIATPGTLFEDELLDGREANYLLAVAEHKKELGVAWADVSTGECAAMRVPAGALHQELGRLAPTELLISDRLHKREDVAAQLAGFKGRVTLRPDNMFAPERGEQHVKTAFGLATLKGVGDFSPCETGALGALVEYVRLTQCGGAPRLSAPKRQSEGRYMAVDKAARDSLELTRNAKDGGRAGTLLSVMDATVTHLGARLLHRLIHNPLASAEAIRRRQDMAQDFLDAPSLRAAFREKLRRMPDLERRLSRVCLGKASPPDLLAIRNGLYCALELAELLEHAGSASLGVAECKQKISGFGATLALLSAALKDEAPSSLKEGGAVADGYHAPLDKIRELAADGDKAVLRLQEEYRRLTGIRSLKIKHNNIIGRHIDVTAAQAESMTADVFIRRQALANSVRYTTQELQELERQLATAAERALAIETEIFAKLCGQVAEEAEAIAATAHACASLDVAAGFAENAATRGYVRPVVDDSLAFAVEGGRHPVLEARIGREFVKNDCDLSGDGRLWLITGPNMAGKSTFLRQNALIALMAQIGSFVPADRAHIGAVDKLFSRVGASDSLAEGHSTFMVEMTETASIVNCATERSLVIMDEIGRGTSTYDGMSIAWAVIEHVHDVNKCRALCATHYHELTQLAERCEGISCRNVLVREWEDGIVFLHKVAPGSADRSYGVHVGKLAGLPISLISRAYEMLGHWEESRADAGKGAAVPENDTEGRRKAAFADAVLRLLAERPPDDLSPREALELLYRIREAAENGRENP
jgi:DNA mismatch repair protein MutS